MRGGDLFSICNREEGEVIYLFKKKAPASPADKGEDLSLVLFNKKAPI
jgi:hypothetical protein